MTPRSQRLTAIDALRGLVMVLMALDHTRDYFGRLENPQDVAAASVPLFFTRWVTHFCAPVFVLLAGTAAWLYGSRGRTKGELSRFLATRGLWLIVLEVTVVNHAWLFDFSFALVFWQVIAVIGVAMLALAALLHLPERAVLAVGLVLVAGHNLLDPILPGPGRALDVWRFVHESGLQPFGLVAVGGSQVLVVYPFLPWIGVMALGYALGPITRLERARRRRLLLRTGGAATLAFVLLRAWNGYGDATPWSAQATPVRTFLSFLNVQKYPPSLAFALMTLGPALVLLGLLDRERPPGRAQQVLIVYGRVPLFYYVAHMYLIHASSMLVHWARYGEPVSQLKGQFSWLPGAGFEALPEGFVGLPLAYVYLAWALVVATLYPACRWYAGVKARSRSPLLSYL